MHHGHYAFRFWQYPWRFLNINIWILSLNKVGNYDSSNQNSSLFSRTVKVYKCHLNKGKELPFLVWLSSLFKWQNWSSEISVKCPRLQRYKVSKWWKQDSKPHSSGLKDHALNLHPLATHLLRKDSMPQCIYWFSLKRHIYMRNSHSSHSFL